MPWLSTHLGFMGNLRPRTMDDADIQDLLRWQAAGARRAMQAGFDIVYVYAGMGYLPYEFLLPEYNRRTDAYGGSIENRVRLVRELLEVTRDAVGDKCAVALRISVEELRGKPGPERGVRGARGGERCSPISRISGTSRWIPVRPTARPRGSPPREATSPSSIS